MVAGGEFALDGRSGTVQIPAIYVISLASAAQRRAFMRRQLDPLGLPYKFFDAVHGAQNPGYYLFKKYNDKERIRRRGKGASLRLSQLGCFASHYLLWEKCMRENVPIIILEDDAALLPPFVQFCGHAARFVHEYGFVWLQPSRKIANQTGLQLGKIGPFSVRKFAKGFSGTTGYLISPEIARTLINYCSEWIYPVDNTLDRFYEHNVEAIGIDPVCIVQDDDLESFINVADSGRKRSLIDTLRRECANLVDSSRRIRHNLTFSMRHKRAKRSSQSES
ncbi:MAG: glycosyltransferase family 25 protein [Burkholderiaceae bacterium]